VRQAGMPVVVHTGIAFALVALACLVVLPGMRNAPARPNTVTRESGEHRIALPNLGLLPLCIGEGL